MKVMWAVIANASVAQIYSFSTDSLNVKNYSLHTTLTHPENSLHTKDLTTDNIGRFHGGAAGHGNFARNDPHQVEVKQFINEVAQYVNKARGENLFQELALVADPSVLGELTEKLSASTKQLPLVKISKNYITAIRDKEYSVEKIIKDIMNQLNESNPVLNSH